jgi:hypothetical protein
MSISFSENNVASGRGSLPSLIGWLSVCLLAAVWGPELNPWLRQVWSILGSFGLVAAFSLEIAERTRTGLSKRARQKAAERRMERSSSDMVVVQDVKSQLCEALRQMLSKTSTRESTTGESGANECGLNRLPITVKPLPANDSDPECADALAIAAIVRNISKNIIGLSHSSPIEGQRVVLSVETDDGGSLRLVGEPQWQLPLRDGSYQSGVRLL